LNRRQSRSDSSQSDYGQSATKRPAGRGKEEVFGEELTHDPHSSGTERTSNA
jgi:hypothetical protein